MADNPNQPGRTQDELTEDNPPKAEKVPEEYKYDPIELGWDSGEFDPTVAKKSELRAYLDWRIAEYKRKEYKDYFLWEISLEDFEGWNADILLKAGRDLCRELCQVLVDRGVHVESSSRIAISERLYRAIITEFDPNQQPFGSSIKKMSDIAKNDQYRSYEKAVGYKSEQTCDSSNIKISKLSPSDSFSTPNPSMDYVRQIGNLNKLYTDDQKYGGQDDVFDFKYGVFLDISTRSGVNPKNLAIAFPTMLKDQALTRYHKVVQRNPELARGLQDIRKSIRDYFETDETYSSRVADWELLNLKDTINKNPGKSIKDCLNIVIDKLETLQFGLGKAYQNDQILFSKLLNTCRGVPACSIACSKPANGLGNFISELRSSIATFEANSQSQAFIKEPTATNEETMFTDRNYRWNRKPDKQNNRKFSRNKRCFVCKNINCWSTKHSKEERDKARQDFKKNLDRRVQQYLASEEEDEEDNEFEALFNDDENCSDSNEIYVTSYGPINGSDVATFLADQSFKHNLIPTDFTHTTTNINPFAYIATTNRYNSSQFYGIMIDTGAAQRSTAGYGQYLAYERLFGGAINHSKAGQVSVQFGIGSATSIGSTLISCPIGSIEFHILETDTPFLLSLKDMKSLNVYLDNIKDCLVQGSREFPVFNRFGHLFLLWDMPLATYLSTVDPFLSTVNIQQCFLTEQELRQLHRRFGHPTVNRLAKLLERSSHEYDRTLLEKISKFCKFCQKHSNAPGRFKFSLRSIDDVQFNHIVYADIMYIDGSPLLHVVDEGTRFQSAHWLKDMSAKTVWETLRRSRIDVCLGPPDTIMHDAGTNFCSSEFKQSAKGMSIQLHQVPTEAHNAVGVVERYHKPLRRAYAIIKEELNVTKDVGLQMAVKAINDTAGPDGIIPTLLVFGAYPRMVETDPPATTVSQRAMAIKKAMEEVGKLRAKQQVKAALNQRNGPNVDHIHSLPIGSQVLVWREKGGWDGPYTLLAINNETCKIQLANHISEFRTTVVKPYLDETEPSHAINSKNTHEKSSNAENLQPTQEIRRNPDRIRQPPLRFIQSNYFTTPNYPASPNFKESRRKELDGLIQKGVFDIVNISDVTPGSRIFKSRFVDTMKFSGTDRAFEKSRLVVQAYKDKGKQNILTQAPTLQRASQRILLSIAISLPDFGSKYQLYLRDISQAYVQSTTTLNRDLFVKPPPELNLPKNYILKILRPLYGIPEAGTHWFYTYQKHHLTKLHMQQSTYDSCLLYTSMDDLLGVVGLQTDDTLFVANENFANLENDKIKEAQFLSKPREILSTSHSLTFNGGLIQFNGHEITITQEKLCDKICTVPTENGKIKAKYIKERARGAYVASVCQPEAAFGLSFAAQAIDPNLGDAKSLNKVLAWQKNNATRGLRFVALDLQTIRLVVFTDSSFANNKDLTSQIGFIIVMADDTGKANIVHWSSIKCRRITRSVLAAELYAMVHGFDVATAIKGTIEGITTLLRDKQPVPLILCTDSRSLYDCIVKLGITNEKRLMIDLIALRQSYERREIAEVRWINGNSNPADALTKQRSCPALKKLIDTNSITL